MDTLAGPWDFVSLELEFNEQFSSLLQDLAFSAKKKIVSTPKGDLSVGFRFFCTIPASKSRRGTRVLLCPWRFIGTVSFLWKLVLPCSSTMRSIFNQKNGRVISETAGAKNGKGSSSIIKAFSFSRCGSIFSSVSISALSHRSNRMLLTTVSDFMYIIYKIAFIYFFLLFLLL